MVFIDYVRMVLMSTEVVVSLLYAWTAFEVLSMLRNPGLDAGSRHMLKGKLCTSVGAIFILLTLTSFHVAVWGEGIKVATIFAQFGLFFLLVGWFWNVNISWPKVPR